MLANSPELGQDRKTMPALKICWFDEFAKLGNFNFSSPRTNDNDDETVHELDVSDLLWIFNAIRLLQK